MPFLTIDEYDDIAMDLLVLLKSRGYTPEEIISIFKYALERAENEENNDK